MRAAALSTRRDLYVSSNAVDIGDEDQTMVRFAATLIVLMLVWTAPVSGYYFSYSKWLELPYDVRVAYIAGAYDTLIGFPDARGNRYVSWDACIKKREGVRGAACR